MEETNSSEKQDVNERLKLECSQYRRERGRLRATVKVMVEGQVLFADVLSLDGAKDRKIFAKQAVGMLKDGGVTPEEIERRLIKLFESAEAKLANGSSAAGTYAPDDLQGVDGRPASRNGYCRFLTSTGGFVLARQKSAEGNEISAQLCTFDARIIEEVLVDEEAGPPHLEYRVTGTDEYGNPLAELTVRAEQFDRLDWAPIRWGLKATVFAGQREHVAIAIRRLSSVEVPRRTIYAHTGFSLVDGERIFLHAGGAISANGPMQDVEVSLPDKLSRYNLPTPPTDPAPSLRFLIGLLDVAPRPMMLIILTLLFAAPLDSTLGAITSLIILGNTGLRKSTLVALLLHVYGGPFTAQSPVTSWEDTANSLEKLGHQAKDLPLWIDDVRPTATRREREQQQQSLQRMLRGTTTRSGRGRLRADLTAAPVYYPRGPIITTAEHLPEHSSTLARTLVLRMGLVNLGRLTEAQAEAPEILPLVGAAWVQFLAAELDDLAPILKKDARDFRDSLIRKYPALHGGVADGVGRLSAAGSAFLAFAGAVGALCEDEVTVLKLELGEALEAAALDTSEHVTQARPSLAFMEALRALLDTKRVVIEGIAQATVLSTPSHSAELLGWKAAINEEGNQKYERTPGAVTVGWLDHVNDLIYLDTAVTLHEVHEYTRDQRAGMPFKPEAVYRELEGQGMLARTDKHQHAVPKKIGGQTKRVLVLHAHALLGEQDKTGSPESGTETGGDDEASS